MKDDILTQVNGAVAFLKKHLNVRSEIRGFDRSDIYEIPLELAWIDKENRLRIYKNRFIDIFKERCMTETMITCPKYQTEIKLTESLVAPIRESAASVIFPSGVQNPVSKTSR